LWQTHSFSLRNVAQQPTIPDGCVLAEGHKNGAQKEDQDVTLTPAFVSRSSIIVFSLVVGVSISADAETATVMDKASTDGSFTIAQTNGMNRRQDRRGDRQDCRQQEGAVGADKRNCKQEGRQTR
jgi:hypothetical protein